MFVIAGGTGNTGSTAARMLLEAGQQVRVLVRKAEKARDLAALGAQVVVGDLWDKTALAGALAGAAGVYLLSPPEPTSNDFVAERRVQLEALARTVREVRVPHVVFLSSMGAHHPGPTGPIRTLYAGEQALLATGLPVTFVRPGLFLENWVPVLPIARRDGVLPSFTPAGLPLPMVAVRDIGAVVGQALLDGPRGHRIIELGGPAEASPADLAVVLTRLLGHPVRVAEAPLEAVVPTFTALGFSAHVAGLFREMYQGLGDGTVTWQGQGAERARGVTSAEQVFERLLGRI